MRNITNLATDESRKIVRGITQGVQVNIHVGNLSPETTESDLRLAFEKFAKVARTHIGKDKVTNVSRGYGFVEIMNSTEALAAIAGMSGKDIKGNLVIVSEARDKRESTANRGTTVAETATESADKLAAEKSDK